MIELSAAEAERRLGEVLDTVERRQQSFAITRDGRVIAQIVPLEREPDERRPTGTLLAHKPFTFDR